MPAPNFLPTADYGSVQRTGIGSELRRGYVKACQALAALLEAHPICSRMRLRDGADSRLPYFEIETRLPDGGWIDAPSLSLILMDFQRAKLGHGYPPDCVPEMAERMGKLLPDADPAEMAKNAKACLTDLRAALAPLLFRLLTHGRAAIPTGAWIERGTPPQGIAALLGFHDIAAEIESQAIDESAGPAPSDGRRPWL